MGYFVFFLLPPFLENSRMITIMQMSSVRCALSWIKNLKYNSYLDLDIVNRSREIDLPGKLGRIACNVLIASFRSD